MKYPLYAVFFGMSALFAAPAFSCDADHTAEMRAQLAKSSSASNVKAVSLSLKASQCEQNAKNFFLRGKAKADYVASCMNKNQALEHLVSVKGEL